MGFDLHGESGNYFRNNCWWWRPLATYVLQNCFDIVDADGVKSWSYNDGYLVRKEVAEKIAERLKTLLQSGHTKEYDISYNMILEATPDEKCDLCGGTGVRTDMKVENGCNGCQGKGTRRPASTWYGFNEENVKEFAEFCEKSEGFSIC